VISDLVSTPSNLLQPALHPLTASTATFDPLLDLIGNAHYVMIGEASHGTHEFYRIRAEITKRLIREKGFSAVAIEGDWPDAYHVNRYVRGTSAFTDASDALGGFRRFPQWMWRNADVLDFVGWLRAHNDSRRTPDQKVGFYGLDLYSLHASIDAVLHYLDKVDADAARRARDHYACFDPFGPDPQAYGYAVTSGVSESCQREVLAELVELRAAASRYLGRDHQIEPDEQFFAEQNARIVARAEEYYRAMFGGRAVSWNLRDRHMMETLDALMSWLAHEVREPKVVVWAHNSHLGDARATEMSRTGELNVGQLVRQQHGQDCRLIGFSTYSGTVTAAHDWGGPAEQMRVRPGLPGSWEELFHQLQLRNVLVIPGEDADTWTLLDHARLQRAIGVIYRPDTERQSHYYHSRLARQFDAVLHYDSTRAVVPLERTARWDEGAVPETYPTAL
jgi:erythromycin esterase-like protein